MKSQPYSARNTTQMLVKGKREASQISGRSPQQKPTGRFPMPAQYSSTENPLTSNSLEYEKEYGTRTYEQNHSTVKKKHIILKI